MIHLNTEREYLPLYCLLVLAGITKDQSQARRILIQSIVYLNGQIISSFNKEVRTAGELDLDIGDKTYKIKFE